MAKFNSLFQDTDIKKQDAHPRKDAKWIHYTKLKSNEKQYRGAAEGRVIELASLIEASGGILQNLIVRKIDTDEYEIIAGHHRRDACRYLVEEKGLTEYEFLPCEVKSISDVLAEFQLYSSNGFVPKTDYERMHEIERMKFLLENFPEAFPHMKSTGRMVERLSDQLHMPKTTVGEYLSISSNLGEKGMQAFKDGEIKKSAAVALARLPEQEQEELIKEGVTSHKEITEFKNAKKAEPSDEEIKKFCELKDLDLFDFSMGKDELVERLRSDYGKSHEGGVRDGLCYQCSRRGVRLNLADEITWASVANRIFAIYADKDDKQSPKEMVEGNAGSLINEKESLPGQYVIANKEMDIEEEADIEPQIDFSVIPQAYDVGILKYFLREAKDRLTMMIAASKKESVPEIAMQRQQVYVFALTKVIEEAEK